MQRTARLYGIARSLAIYYGIPLRGRRLARFYAQFVAPGMLCFDVGAHVGNRIRAWRRLGARVVAIEPQRDLSRLLTRWYGRDGQVTVLETALGRTAGTATMHVSDRTPTVTTLSREWLDTLGRDPRFAGVAWPSRQEVRVTTLDALIAEHGEPGFVKIDIEGYEAEALAGLSQPLPALSFEYLPATRGIALECIDRLETLGRYRFNRSPGESHELVRDDWIDAARMREEIAGLPADGRSGDVYARLVR